MEPRPQLRDLMKCVPLQDRAPWFKHIRRKLFLFVRMRRQKKAAAVSRQGLSLCLSFYLWAGFLIWNVSAVAWLGPRQITLLFSAPGHHWNIKPNPKYASFYSVRSCFRIKPKLKLPSESKKSVTQLLKSECYEKNIIFTMNTILCHTSKSLLKWRILPLCHYDQHNYPFCRPRNIAEYSLTFHKQWSVTEQGCSYPTAIMKKMSFV